MTLVDPHGRKINYLRLSVTDRCNLRCHYCMPQAGVAKVGHGDLLTYEQHLFVARAAVSVGVEKIRVTGGEPLLRKGIIPFLERLAATPGLKRLVLTTNGILLKEMALELRNAGIASLNISLDSLRADTFSHITRGGVHCQVLEGIDAAEQAGFPQIKINCVIMRGINDDEVEDFAALTLKRPFRVRFIEYMPTINSENWQAMTVPGTELLERLSRRYTLEPIAREEHAGPAVNYRISGATGMIGIITPVSCHFCRDCNRIRVTSTGKAKSCLFADSTTDLKPYLQSADMSGLCEALREVVTAKPDRHQLGYDINKPPTVAMSRIGG